MLTVGSPVNNARFSHKLPCPAEMLKARDFFSVHNFSTNAGGQLERLYRHRRGIVQEVISERDWWRMSSDSNCSRTNGCN